MQPTTLASVAATGGNTQHHIKAAQARLYTAINIVSTGSTLTRVSSSCFHRAFKILPFLDYTQASHIYCWTVFVNKLDFNNCNIFHQSIYFVHKLRSFSSFCGIHFSSPVSFAHLHPEVSISPNLVGSHSLIPPFLFPPSLPSSLPKIQLWVWAAL